MNEIDSETQAREVVGRGLARELGVSRATTAYADDRGGKFRFELNAYRSLGPTGFQVVMAIVIAVNAVVGIVFTSLGAWPVLAFCGLDVVLIYWAFRSNYRSGRASEIIEVTPGLLTLTRTHPSGSNERFEFNPYWVRVRLLERPDGRNDLWLTSHGTQFHFAKFLSDDERRDFAESLTRALLVARSTRASI
jgi:uncharacterized membrane protein